jgi:Uncharacterised nucleotidyltransferase
MAAVPLTAMPEVDARPPRRARPELWDRVDALIDRAPGLAELELHGLQLLAARRWRELGRPVPQSLVQAERSAAVFTMFAPVVLAKIRAAVDGPIVLMKGPEAAAAYPDPMLRPFRDLDLLVPDAKAAHEALVAAGFKLTGLPDRYVDLHHLRPLRLPGLPLLLELHSRPKWVEGMRAPSTDELIEAARPSTIGVDGILGLPPAEHTLVIAAHSWGHAPFGRLIQLVDVAALAEQADGAEIEALARRWRARRLWRTTRRVADAALGSASKTFAQRIWARNVATAREQTVLESHLEAWLAPFWALSPPSAVAAVVRGFAGELRRVPGETWREKLVRTRYAFRNAFSPLSEHERELDEAGLPSGDPEEGIHLV